MGESLTFSALPCEGLRVPGLIAIADERAQLRFLEFFASNIRNAHTRRAYGRAAEEFLGWCHGAGVASLSDVQPLHVAAWVEDQARLSAAPTVKQKLAGIRSLFDWLVVGQVVPVNPAASVRGPRHVARSGKTPALEPEETRALIDSIPTGDVVGLRDRALIALMVYSFARVGAALAMTVEDVFVQNRRFWVRLHEKNGKVHTMPCHHNLERYLHEYLEGSGLQREPKAPLFPSMNRETRGLGARTLTQSEAHAMIRRRAKRAGIETRLGNHSFRATGITAYLKNGGTLENAAAMANHSSTRTTQLYDRRREELTLDEVERIVI